MDKQTQLLNLAKRINNGEITPEIIAEFRALKRDCESLSAKDLLNPLEWKNLWDNTPVINAEINITTYESAVQQVAVRMGIPVSVSTELFSRLCSYSKESPLQVASKLQNVENYETAQEVIRDLVPDDGQYQELNRIAVNAATASFLGVKTETAEAFTSKLHAWLGIDYSTMADAGKAGSESMEKILAGHDRYTSGTEILPQIQDRMTDSYRSAALAGIKARQMEAGMENLRKITGDMLSDEDRRKIIGTLQNTGVEAAITQAQRMLAANGGEGFSSVVAGALFDNFKKFTKGFLGDGSALYSRMAQGTASVRAIESIGKAADWMTLGAVKETGYATADDFRSTLANMIDNGFRADAYIVRGTEDRYLLGQKLLKNTDSWNRFAREQWAKRLSAIDPDAFQDTESYQAVVRSERARFNNQMNNLYGSIANGEEINPASVPETLQKDFDTASSANVLREAAMPRVQSEAFVQRIAQGLRGAEDRMPGGVMDPRYVQELIQITNGNQQNKMDYSEAAMRTARILTVAKNNDIDLKTLGTAVSGAGKMMKSMNMDTENLGAVAEFGFSLFNQAMSNPGRNAYADKQAVLGQSIQNAVRVVNSRSADNAAWLATHAIVGDDAEAVRLRTLKEKLNRGEVLTAEDMEFISDRGRLEKASGMSSEEFYASMKAENLENTRKTMDLNTSAAVQRSAMESEQAALDRKLGESYASDTFQTLFTEKQAKALGYEQGEAWDTTRQLMRMGFGSQRTLKLLTGQEELTSSDKERILKSMGKEAGSRFTERLRNVADRNAGRTEQERRDAASAASTALEAAAGTVEMTGEQLAVTLTPQDEQQQKIFQRGLELEKTLNGPMKGWLQRSVENIKDGKEGVLNFTLNGLEEYFHGGGKISEQDIREMLTAETSMTGVLQHASTINGDAKDFQDFLGVKDSKVQDFLDSLTARSGQNFKTMEELQDYTKKASLEELQDLGAALGATEYGTTTREALVQEVDRQVQEAEKKASEAPPEELKKEPPEVASREARPALGGSDRDGTQEHPFVVVVQNADQMSKVEVA